MSVRSRATPWFRAEKERWTKMLAEAAAKPQCGAITDPAGNARAWWVTIPLNVWLEPR